MGNLVDLKQLWLFSTDVTGSIPSELANLANLQELQLNSNDLTGSIPSELGDLANLKRLRLYNNELTGSIPSELANLQELQLNSNDLTGPIPSELGNLASLQRLWLYNNDLTGSIPSELGDLANLQELSLYSNDLTGPIPSKLGSLIDLKRLWLYNNDLTGPIPSELGDLTNLRELSLYSNELIGPIPSELGNLANLHKLYLSGNKLIPPVYVDVTNLRTLRLDYPENGKIGIVNISATGLEEGAITWSLSGDDADDFAVSSAGVLTFDPSPDYETPTDKDGNNLYSVTVEAPDGTSSGGLSIIVGVIDTDITLSVSPSELSEGDSLTDVTVTATLDGGTPAATDTQVALSLGGSAVGSGTDYTAGTLPTITINGASPSAAESLSITLEDDRTVEGDETIVVQGTAAGFTVTPATTYLRDQNTATGDPDKATLSLSGPNTVLNEGEDASFTVALSPRNWLPGQGGLVRYPRYGSFERLRRIIRSPHLPGRLPSWRHPDFRRIYQGRRRVRGR